MSIRIWTWEYRGQRLHSMFFRHVARRKVGRQFALRENIHVAQCELDLTDYEVGQLLGGN